LRRIIYQPLNLKKENGQGPKRSIKSTKRTSTARVVEVGLEVGLEVEVNPLK